MNEKTNSFTQTSQMITLCKQHKCHIFYHSQLTLTETFQTEMASNTATELMSLIKRKS